MKCYPTLTLPPGMPRPGPKHWMTVILTSSLFLLPWPLWWGPGKEQPCTLGKGKRQLGAPAVWHSTHCLLVPKPLASPSAPLPTPSCLSCQDKISDVPPLTWQNPCFRTGRYVGILKCPLTTKCSFFFPHRKHYGLCLRVKTNWEYMCHGKKISCFLCWDALSYF